MKSIFFELVTPEGILYEGDIVYLKAPGVEGEFGIYPDHVPFFTLLKEGILQLNPASKGQSEYFAITNGVFSFFENRMSVLAEEAFNGAEVDKAEEKKLEKDLLAKIEKYGSDANLESMLNKVRLRIRSREMSDSRNKH